jgi:hypothetical protein
VESPASSKTAAFPTLHYEDISLAEWLARTPWRLVDEHFQVGELPEQN